MVETAHQKTATLNQKTAMLNIDGAVVLSGLDRKVKSQAEISTFLAICQAQSYVGAVAILQLQEDMGQRGQPLTESAVRGRIKRLQEVLGGPALFSNVKGKGRGRSKGSVLPTPYGRKFLSFAVLMDELWSRALNEMGLFKESTATIVIGVRFSLFDHIGRKFVAEMLDKHPKAAIQIRVGENHQLLEWLNNHTIDIALAYDEPQRDGLTSTKLGADVMILVASEKYASFGNIEQGKYVLVDYGRSFIEFHKITFHGWAQFQKPQVVFDRAGPALRYLQMNKGSAAYIPFRMAQRYLNLETAPGERLFIVPNTVAKKRNILIVTRAREEHPAFDRIVEQIGGAADPVTSRTDIIKDARQMLLKVGEDLHEGFAAVLEKMKADGIKVR